MSQNKSNKSNVIELNSHETRIALLEQSTIYLKESIDEIKSSLNRLDEKIDSHFKWLLMTIAGLAGIMAHGFHWI